ncbi:hypothetical protein A2U01_0095121, partial [Trifolium medium]|nr:hypothetical protein [Trifolium medium]
AHIKYIESIMAQHTKSLEGKLEVANAKIQQLTKQVSKLTTKKCQAVELRNRAVEIVEKPKDGKKVKDPDSMDTHEK